MLGPSRVFFPTGTMASADFLQFVVTTHFFRICLLNGVCKTSPGTRTFFPSLPATFTVSDSVQLLGFVLSGKLALAHGLICDFYSSGQRFAAAFLQILPHDRHPWLKLYPSRCRVDSGLSPFGTCAHRAHLQHRPYPIRGRAVCRMDRVTQSPPFLPSAHSWAPGSGGWQTGPRCRRYRPDCSRGRRD